MREPAGLDRLDAAQRGAVLCPAPQRLIIAGPGSGKTLVLAAAFARLIERGVKPGSILFVTFTNRAAQEMRKRVSVVTGLDTSTLSIGTFHGFCLGFLKKERPGLRLIGPGAASALVKGLGVKNADKAIRRISTLKNRTKGAHSEEEQGLEAGDMELLTAYEQALREREALDLDDLILKTVDVLTDDPLTLKRYRDLFPYVLVDEYQDINPSQARLVILLSQAGAPGGEGNGVDAGLLAIGDPDQTIYAFRGANIEGFTEFERNFPEGEVLSLGINYRSPSSIVRASRSVIEHNPTSVVREIRAQRQGGEITLIECPDERTEARFIVREIETLMGGLTSRTTGGREDGAEASFSDFAVLFRTNRQGAALADAFGSSQIPFQSISPLSDKEIEGFAEHLMSAARPLDAALPDFILEQGKKTGTDERVVERFLSATMLTSGNGLEGLIEQAYLSTTADTYAVEADRVALMTLHMAKGLEWATVFITGCEDGLVPLRSSRMHGECRDMEEERRLFYVGMTRAGQKLYLMHARERRLWGRTLAQNPSPFLGEIPEGLLKKISLEKRKPKKRPAQKGLFD